MTPAKPGWYGRRFRLDAPPRVWPQWVALLAPLGVSALALAVLMVWP